MQHHQCPCKERNTRAHSHGGKRGWPSKSQGEVSGETELADPLILVFCKNSFLLLKPPPCLWSLLWQPQQTNTVFFLSPKFCIYKIVLIALDLPLAARVLEGLKTDKNVWARRTLGFIERIKTSLRSQTMSQKFYKPECYIFPVFSQKTPFLNHSYNKMGRKRGSWGCLVQGSYFL